MSPLRIGLDALRGRWGVLLLAAALAGVVSACRGGLVLLVKAVVDRLDGGGAAALVPLACLAVALFAVQGAARVGRLLATRGAAYRAEAGLRARLFSHLLGRDPAALRADGVGESLAALMHDVGAVRTAVGAAVTIVQRPLTALAVGGAAFWMAPRLAAVGLLLGPVVAGVVVWTGRRTRRAASRHLEHLAAVQAGAQDDLLGARTLQAYGAEEGARARHAEADAAQVDAALRRTLFQALGPPLVEVAAAAALGAVVVLGAAEVASGSLTSGALVAFLVAVALLHEPLKGIAVAHGLWEEARAGLTRVGELLDRPSGVPDAAGARALDDRVVRIELRGVSVDRGRGPVLDGVDLTLAPGRIVTVRGETGAGKTTLLDVLARFVSPDAGRVLVNGAPADEWTTGSLRAAMALVDQAPWLGRGTVADAVRLGRPEASDADVSAALAAAGLPSDVGLLTQLPGGIHGRIGDGGGDVSGGERRRIALARALVRDAPVLLLDEPTSGLDAATEARFLETVRAVSPGRIVVIVAHREACSDVADVVYELVEGRLRVVRAPGVRCA